MNESMGNSGFDAMDNAGDAVSEKLLDAATPGYQAEFDPEEAERAGAFIEDALSECDALASTHDLLDVESTESEV